MVVALKSQEGFGVSGIFILLPSQCNFYLFLVIISLLLFCKAIPILFIPAVLFLFSFSIYFIDMLVEYFHFNSDFRLFQNNSW